MTSLLFSPLNRNPPEDLSDHHALDHAADNNTAERKSPMTKCAMTETILNAKDAKSVSWAEIAKAVGLSEVYTTSACLGENLLSGEEAGKLAGLLGLNASVTEALRPTCHQRRGGDDCTQGAAPVPVSGDPLCLRRDAEKS